MTKFYNNFNFFKNNYNNLFALFGFFIFSPKFPFYYNFELYN